MTEDFCKEDAQSVQTDEDLDISLLDGKAEDRFKPSKGRVDPSEEDVFGEVYQMMKLSGMLLPDWRTVKRTKSVTGCVRIVLPCFLLLVNICICLYAVTVFRFDQPLLSIVSLQWYQAFFWFLQNLIVIGHLIWYQLAGRIVKFVRVLHATTGCVGINQNRTKLRISLFGYCFVWIVFALTNVGSVWIAYRDFSNEYSNGMNTSNISANKKYQQLLVLEMEKHARFGQHSQLITVLFYIFALWLFLVWLIVQSAFHAINLVVMLEFRHFNGELKQHRKQFNDIYVLGDWLNKHHNYCSLVDKVDSMLRSYVLCMLCTCIPTLITVGYGLIKSFDSEQHWALILQKFVFAVGIFLQACALTQAPAGIFNEVREIEDVICKTKTVWVPFRPQHYALVTGYLQRLTTSEIGVTVGGLVYINRQSIVTICSLVITAVTVLPMIDSEVLDQNCECKCDCVGLG